MKELKRECPKCKNIITYVFRSSLTRAKRKNSICPSCSKTDIWKQKISSTLTGKLQSEETKHKRSVALKGKHPFCGMKFSDEYKKKISLGHRKLPYEWLYNGLKERSKERNICVNLTYEDFLIFTSIKNCNYCGSIVNWIEYSSKERKHSPYNIDRKDSNKGYTKDNCVVCCKICNYTKGNWFSYDEMLELGAPIKNILEKRKLHETNLF